MRIGFDVDAVHLDNPISRLDSSIVGRRLRVDHVDELTDSSTAETGPDREPVPRDVRLQTQVAQTKTMWT